MAQERIRVTTPVFRVSFPHVFKPQPGMKQDDGSSGPDKYGISAIFDPSSFTVSDKKRWKQMKDAADQVSKDAFKKPLDKLPGNFKNPFRDGAEKEELEGYGEGKIFVSLTSRMKPGLIDRSRNDILDQDDFFPGCYAVATVSPFHFSNKGKGVAFGLNNIMKVADGERLDARTDAREDFEDLGEEELPDEVEASDDPLLS